MALTSIEDGVLDMTSGPGTFDIGAAVAGPCVAAAAIDFTALDTCVVNFQWFINSTIVFAVVYRSADMTIDAATAGGFLVPPCPVAVTAQLKVELVSGTPTGDLGFAIYAI